MGRAQIYYMICVAFQLYPFQNKNTYVYYSVIHILQKFVLVEIRIVGAYKPIPRLPEVTYLAVPRVQPAKRV